MTDEEKMASHKLQTVAALIAVAPRGWRRLFCDYESLDGPMGSMGSELAFAVVKRLFRRAKLVEVNLDLARNVATHLNEIARLTMRANDVRQCKIDVIVQDAINHDWHFDFSATPRLSAIEAGDLEAVDRNPDLQKPYRKFAAQDQWLARIS
jgi:hypothetical protein